MKRNLIIYSILLAVTAVPIVRAEDNPGPEAIRQILTERIEKEKRATGMVVGIVDERGANIVACGRVSANSTNLVNGDTVFEIGSVSKVFTSLLLADMVQKGEVKLDDPVAKYLPTSVKVPERNGKKITLVDLATQSSGLPRMPDNFNPKDPSNPYADY